MKEEVEKIKQLAGTNDQANIELAIEIFKSLEGEFSREEKIQLKYNIIRAIDHFQAKARFKDLIKKRLHPFRAGGNIPGKPKK